MATYSEKLKDPRWQKKRLDILSRDVFACKLCKDAETELHVHHKAYKYGSEPWEYDDDNFITYCKHCHLLVEEFKDRFVIHEVLLKEDTGVFIITYAICSVVGKNTDLIKFPGVMVFKDTNYPIYIWKDYIQLLTEKLHLING